jgi:hypothetical protein
VDVGSTLKTMLSAAPELAKTPLLTVSLAQGASATNQLDPNANATNKAAAQSTALSLILLGMKDAAEGVSQVDRQPKEPGPRL